MITVITIIHVIVALFMIGVVLLQSGKGAGMGAAFGGGASQAAFGGGGGLSFMGKLTATAATVFMITSMTLAYFASRTDSLVDDVLDQEAPQAVQEEVIADEPEQAVPVKAEAAGAVEEKQPEAAKAETVPVNEGAQPVKAVPSDAGGQEAPAAK